MPETVRFNVFAAVVFAGLLMGACKERGDSDATSPAGKASNEQSPGDAADASEVDSRIVELNNRGVGLMGRFEYEQALQAFEQAHAALPRNADVLVNRAIATLNRQREGDEQAALEMLADAQSIDSDHLRAIYCEGLLRLYLQSPGMAQPNFERIAQADPDDAYAAYYLGQCLAQQRQYERAVEQYERAIALDGRIRSAYYASSQAFRALGRDEQAAGMLEEFQALERHPQARLAEFKYTRMGPKAMAQVIDANGTVARPQPIKKPDGSLFLDPAPLLSNGDQFKWKAAPADRAVSITAVDIEHDGDIDIFIANALAADDGLHNAVCINDGSGAFTLEADHPLAGIADVNAALWGDFDNDGLTDVYLCRAGANMLWQQSARGEWHDATAATQTANGEVDSVDGAMFDADHDGDLDIFVVNANGPNELLNNNLDGTFKPIAAEAGIAGEGTGSRQVLPVDLDNDRDVDIIVLNSQPPHDVWINERGWNYRRADADAYGWLTAQSVDAIAAADSDVDGICEPYLLAESTGIQRLRRNQSGGWTNEGAGRTGPGPARGRAFRLIDSAGDGSLHAFLISGDRWSIVNLDTGVAKSSSAVIEGISGGAVVVLDADGPCVVVAPDLAPPQVWRPGPGRFPFATVSFTGRQVTSDNKQIRSNASGIGVHFAARIGSNWVAGHTLRQSSGPGQSLQPIAIGLGGASTIDFLSMTWSDGVFQTELDLEAGKHHVIEETERQLSSCPVLFAWNGERFEFITDILGVGGMGYLVSPGPPAEYAPSRPWENLLLPQELLQPRDGEFVLKLGEPMEEACYLDSAALIAYDLPEGWSMTVDDRMHIAGGPEPTGSPLFYRESAQRVPVRAVNDRQQDQAQAISKADLIAADVGEVDDRFIGRLRDEHVLEFEFAASHGDEASSQTHRRWALVIDGWVEYPYSQTSFAAWQAKAAYQAPTLEVRTGDSWTIVYEQFGYPAGFPRQMALPLPENTDWSSSIELRLRTNQEIYFDRIMLVELERCDEVRTHHLPLTGATLAETGFALRTTGPQRQPDYDYQRRAPLWDTRYQRGLYTEIGPCEELVAQADDALAIFGPGEEVELRYDALSLPTLPPGWTRRLVFESQGWCKDMDLYTRHGETVGPLPKREPGRDPAARDAMHSRFNTRFRSGG